MAKWKDLTLAEKVKIINELELPGTQASVAKKYGISNSQVSRLAKNKEDILRAFENGGNHRRKRKRESKEKEAGDALFLWFEQKLGQGARLSGPILKKKATDLTLTLGTEFTTWFLRKSKEKGRMQTYSRPLNGNVNVFLEF